MLDKFIIDPLRQFAEYLLSVSLEGISWLISRPTNISDMPYILSAVKMVQWIAGTFLLVVVMYEVVKTMIRLSHGDGGKPIDKIFLDGIKAVLFIYLSPYLIQNILIPLNNALMLAISKLDFAFDPSQVNHAIDMISPGTSFIGQVLTYIILVIVMALGLIVLVILAGLRIAQIGFLMVIGPLLAVSNASEGQAYRTWIIESVAVVFTQSFHMFCLGFLGSMIINFDFWNFIASFGVLVLMIMGPSVLKQFIHNSGFGGAVTGAVRMVAYQRLMRGVRR